MEGVANASPFFINFTNMKELLKCYDGLVGMRSVCGGSDMIYDIADLGVSLKSAAKSVDSKWTSGSEMVKSKIKQAWREVINDVLLQGYQFKKVVCEKTIGTRSYNLTELTNGSGTIELVRHGSRRGETLMYISSISVNATGSYTLSIDDNEGNTFSYTGTDAVLNIRKHFTGKTINVTIDYTSVNSGMLATVANHCTCADCDVFTRGSQNFGLTLDIQEVCDKEAYLCRYSEILAEAVWYKAAALILKELMDTDRVNDFTIMKEDTLAVNVAMFDSSLNIFKFDDKAFVGGAPNVADGKYQDVMKRISKQVAIPKKGCCVECAGGSYQIALP